MVILDIDMPKNCGECPLISYYGDCIDSSIIPLLQKRPDGCPIKREISELEYKLLTFSCASERGEVNEAND